MRRRWVSAAGAVGAAAAVVVGATSMTTFPAFAAGSLAGSVSAVGAVSGVGAVSAAGAVRASLPRPALVSALGDRIAGTDRYDTAGKIAAQFGGAGTVVIANGTADKQGFDALSANYLAGIVGAPILLTDAAALPSPTAAAVKAVLQGSGESPYAVYVMGEADSVSDAVVAQINAVVQSISGDTWNHVVRVAGGSRYDTAVAAANFNGDDPAGRFVEPYTIGSGSTLGKTAFLASGTSNADALAAGPISNALRIPVYLTPADGLPASVAGALKGQGITNLVVLGGADRVPEAVVAQAKAAGVSTAVRIAGGDRFETAAKLYDFARATLATGDGTHYGSAGSAPVFLANGLAGFPDALAVGPLAAQGQAALLTTPSDSLAPAASAFLTKYASGISSVTALGTAATVSDAVLSAAKAAIG